ncbi:MAG: family 43 glycosylhydrolase [bacterium]|nr:family 43 glycosylhydrolase [bacterium]MCM1375797.1 family 43 glycosylhydrolase [Muribaculum sp.]
MIYNISMKIEHLLENDKAVQILEQHLPGLLERAKANAQAVKLSVEQMVRYARLPQAETVLEKLDAALRELNTPGNAISPSEVKQIAFFREIAEREAEKKEEIKTPHTQDAIYPGQPWLDTKGERIQAHGGAVYYEDGVYYWYGENKEYTDGKNGIWTWGLKIYASKDLYNWEDRGYLIPPVPDDPDNALFPAKRVDRPHIVKCEKTGKYVCWIKLSGPEAAFSIWQADKLTGPYETVENLYNPGGHKAGDFDLTVDTESQKAYLYFDADHTSMLCMELSEDYLHAEKEVGKSYRNLMPPFTREAPALFEAGGRKYMVTSGMTGYIPNKSDAAAADGWDKEFISIGNPHVEDDSHASFNSQISKIFKVEGKENFFIAMADRWVPSYRVDARIADLFTRVIANRYDPQNYQATDGERREMYAANVLEEADTSVADYVWLPIHIEEASASCPQGRVRIEWKDKWRVED